MADDDDKDSKTEDPTEKRKQDALEEGNVPFSRELTAFASTVAIYVYVVFFVTDGSLSVAAASRTFSNRPINGDLNHAPT